MVAPTAGKPHFEVARRGNECPDDDVEVEITCEVSDDEDADHADELCDGREQALGGWCYRGGSSVRAVQRAPGVQQASSGSDGTLCVQIILLHVMFFGWIAIFGYSFQLVGQTHSILPPIGWIVITMFGFCVAKCKGWM